MDWLLTDGVHWALALIPVLVLLAIFVWLDSFALMSLSEVIVLLVLGGIAALAAYPLSGRFLDALPIGFSSYSRFVAPWIEEALKGIGMILLFRMNRVGYKIDAVISGFAIGAGFSLVENILYLSLFPSYGSGTWLVRGFGTALMHGTTLALLGVTAHEFAERENRGAAGDFDFRLWWFAPGYLLAVALHTAFNQFPDRPLTVMLAAALLAPLAVIASLHLGTSEAAQWLEQEHAEHKSQLATLRSGAWPDTAAGRAIAALADRLGPESAARIRRYWELQAWLVAEAEETMIEEACGDAVFSAREVRAALAERDSLRRQMGRITFAAFNALLPFSRNDLWEIAELSQRAAAGSGPSTREPT